MNRPRAVDLLASNHCDANPTAAKFQAAFVARRYRLAPTIAAVIAQLAFGSAVRA